MAEGENNILFGAEWDGRQLDEGVNEVISKLAELKIAEAKIRDQLKEVNKEIDFNTKALVANKEALAKATDPKDIEKFTKNIAVLSKNEEVLKDNLRFVNENLIVVTKGTKTYNEEINRMIKNNQAVGLTLEKFTNLNHLAAEGVRKVGNFAKEAAFGLIAGFAGGIVSTVIPAITQWVDELVSVSSELDELKKNQQALSEIQTAAAGIFSGDVARLETFRLKLTDLNIPQEERIRLAKEYNKTAEEGNKIAISEIDNIGLLNAAITRQIEKIEERARARAFENVLAQKIETVFKAEIKLAEVAPEIDTDALDKVRKNIESTITKAVGKFDIKGKVDVKEIFAFADLPQGELLKLAETNDQLRILTDKSTRDQLLLLKQQKDNLEAFRQGAKDAPNEVVKLQGTIAKGQEEIQRILDIGRTLVTPEGLIGKPVKEKETKEIENEFERRFNELQAKLKAIVRKSFETEGTIRDEFETALKKETDSINAVDPKKLTTGQKAILIDLLVKINDAQVAQSLEAFNEKILAAQRKINDALEQLQNEADLKRIENIGNDFERQRLLIEEKSDSIADTLVKKQGQMLADLEKAGLGEQAKESRRFKIEALFADLLDQNRINANKAQIDNAFKQYLAAVRDGNVLFERLTLQADQTTAASILAAKSVYDAGAITYEEYQKRVTKALNDQKDARERIRLLELQSDLRSFQARLAITTDDDSRKKLEELIRKTESDIARVQIEQGKPDKDDPNAKRAASLAAYAKALGTVLKTIVSFWQQVNATEQAALDRSIALQQRRVDNARDIADKGNAEYLELEQKRLDTLQAKREANARKTLAINQALTLSEALLAAVTAISQAVKTGTVIAGIGAAVAIFGVIASAFAFANSLQTPVATFYKGEEVVKQKGHPSGIDTIPARVSIGERIVTAKENKDYFPALTAIHNRKVAPEVMNSFVENVLKTGGREVIHKIPGEKVTIKGGEKVVEKIVERIIDRGQTFTDTERVYQTEREKADRFVREVVNSISSQIQQSNLKTSLIVIQKELQKQITDKEFLKLVIPAIVGQITERASSNVVKELSTSRQFTILVSQLIKTVYEREKVSSQSDQKVFESKQQSSKESKEVVDKKDHQGVHVESNFYSEREKETEKSAISEDQTRIPELKKEIHDKEKSSTKEVEKTIEKTSESVKEVLGPDKSVAAKPSEPSSKHIPVGTTPAIEQKKEAVEKSIPEEQKPGIGVQLPGKELTNEIVQEKSVDKLIDRDRSVEKTEVTQPAAMKPVIVTEKVIHENILSKQTDTKEASKEVEKVTERLEVDKDKTVDKELIFGSSQSERERHFFYHNNKEYHSAIKAIMTKAIPAEVINNFVENKIRSQIEKDNRRYERVDRDTYTFEDYRREREAERIAEKTVLDRSYKESFVDKHDHKESHDSSKQITKESHDHSSEKVTSKEVFKQDQSRDIISSSVSAGREVLSSKKEHIIDQKTIEKLLPATMINSFIKNYPINQVPDLNFDRIARAQESKTVQVDNEELENRLDKLDRTMNRVVEAIQGTGLEIDIDENGFNIRQSKIAKRLRIRQNS